jgi:hypothetical protein
MKLNRSIDQIIHSSACNDISAMSSFEQTQEVIPLAENDEVRRWYAVLKFCPSVLSNTAAPQWDQSY